MTSRCGAFEFTDRPVEQQFGALADVGKRRLEFVGHVAQEAVLLLGQLQQAQAQPVELPPESLEVASDP